MQETASLATDTIVAQATAPGRGGVGIVRISGPLATNVAKHVLKTELKPRIATYTGFYDAENTLVDQGLAIQFVAPHSFTGEDVLELQGHGGQVVMDMLIDAVLAIDG